MNIFYVYQWLRSVDSQNGPAGSPYYVGKGHGLRAYRRKSKGTHPPKDHSCIVIVADGLTEREALEKEQALISFYGRIDNATGCLRNRTDGGEGVSGAKWKRKPFTEEHRHRLSLALQGRPGHPVSPEVRERIAATLTGVKHSAERVCKIAAANKGQHRSPATEFKKGQPMPAEMVAKSAATRKGRPAHPNSMAALADRRWSDESREKLSGSLRSAWQRKRHGMTGRKHTKESRMKMSLAAKGKPHPHKGQVFSEESRQRMSVAQKLRFAKAAA